MCLSIPAKILSLDGNNNKAKVDWDGKKTIVDTSLLPGILSKGDYIIVHESTNMAIQKLDADDAREIFEQAKTCGHVHHSHNKIKVKE